MIMQLITNHLAPACDIFNLRTIKYVISVTGMSLKGPRSQLVFNRSVIRCVTFVACTCSEKL